MVMPVRYARGRGASRSRMRRAIGVEQPVGIDGGIDLRRRQRGVAEQFLDGAQIAAAGQKMRRETVAQRYTAVDAARLAGVYDAAHPRAKS